MQDDEELDEPTWRVVLAYVFVVVMVLGTAYMMVMWLNAVSIPHS